MCHLYVTCLQMIAKELENREKVWMMKFNIEECMVFTA